MYAARPAFRFALAAGPAALLLLLCACDEPRRTGGAGSGGGGGGGGGGGNEPPPACAGIDCSGHGRCATAGGAPVCVCDPGFHRVELTCVADDPCTGVTCNGHGTCTLRGANPYCDCEDGFRTVGANCVAEDDPCGGQTCSGKGICRIGDDGNPVCVCTQGYTPSNRSGLDCVPTETLCKGGPTDVDTDDDGLPDGWFEPLPVECEMFELVNRTRATHDTEGAPECHHPLQYSLEWSAHGRHHSKKMFEARELFHDDFPSGQNCAYGCSPDCEMNMYMTGPNEPHCPAQSHHCNIMSCGFTYVGIGTYQGHWNTQNFF